MCRDRKLEAVRDQQFQNEKKMESSIWMYHNSMWTVAGIQIKLWLKRGWSETVSTGLCPNKSPRLHAIKGYFHWNYLGASAQEITFMPVHMLLKCLAPCFAIGQSGSQSHPFLLKYSTNVLQSLHTQRRLRKEQASGRSSWFSPTSTSNYHPFNLWNKLYMNILEVVNKKFCVELQLRRDEVATFMLEKYRQIFCPFHITWYILCLN